MRMVPETESLATHLTGRVILLCVALMASACSDDEPVEKAASCNCPPVEDASVSEQYQTPGNVYQRPAPVTAPNQGYMMPSQTYSSAPQQQGWGSPGQYTVPAPQQQSWGSPGQYTVPAAPQQQSWGTPGQYTVPAPQQQGWGSQGQYTFPKAPQQPGWSSQGQYTVPAEPAWGKVQPTYEAPRHAASQTQRSTATTPWTTHEQAPAAVQQYQYQQRPWGPQAKTGPGNQSQFGKDAARQQPQPYQWQAPVGGGNYGWGAPPYGTMPGAGYPGHQW